MENLTCPPLLHLMVSSLPVYFSSLSLSPPFFLLLPDSFLPRFRHSFPFFPSSLPVPPCFFTEGIVKELKSQRIDTIELDTPSPSPAKRSRVNNSSLSSSAMPADPPQNPDFPGIGESDGLEELDDELQNALEFEGGHGSLDGFENACLVVALQNLGCPVACPRDGPFTALDGCVMLRPLGASLQIIPETCR